MSSQPAFCPKCGAPREVGAAFCSRCGTSFITTAVPPSSSEPSWSRRDRRHEKSENREKREKGEKPEKGRGDLTGALIGGGVLIWLGLLVYLQSVGIVSGSDMGGLFLIGIGGLIILGGIEGKISRGRPVLGYLVGGLVLIVLGTFAIYGFTAFAGAIFLVFLGLVIIFLAYDARRRSPAPNPPAPM